LVTELEGGRFELVAGERRLRASKMAGLTHVPCTIKKYSNRERFEVALIENIQRQDLNALEEAVAFNAIMVEYNLTQDQLAVGLGKSRSSIANSLRLLRLHDEVQAAVRGGLLSEGHAKCLAGVADQEEQLKWMRRVIDEKLSVRDLENLLFETKPLKGAAGSRKSAKKDPSAEIKRYEEEFQRALGRRVEIQSAGQKGWLRFAFYSPSDLDLLCRQLGLINNKNEKEFS
jgi:ParB family chromosome partitioning protein